MPRQAWTRISPNDGALLMEEQLLEKVLERIARLEEKQKHLEEFPTTGIVSARRIKMFFGISKVTLARWIQLGLKPLKLGTRAQYFLAEDVLDLCRQKSEPPPYKSQVVQRIEARKKGLIQ